MIAVAIWAGKAENVSSDCIVGCINVFELLHLKGTRLQIFILPTEKNGMQPWVLMNNAKGGMKMDRTRG